MFAQILKVDMRVNLVGGEGEGLPTDHLGVICVDIGSRTDVKIGMKYNESTKEFYTEAPLPIPPKQLREQAYETMLKKNDETPLIVWEGQSITVDQANKSYLEYTAEGSTKASQIQSLIAPAKAYIRSLYPDNV